MKLDPGAHMGSASVVSQAIKATADPQTMEITSLDDLSVAASTETRKHKFARLEWLPIVFVPVVIFFCAVGGGAPIL